MQRPEIRILREQEPLLCTCPLIHLMIPHRRKAKIADVRAIMSSLAKVPTDAP